MTIAQASAPTASRRASFAALLRRVAAWLKPLGRREGWIIGAAGAVAMLLIAAFTGMIVRQIDTASRQSNREHVEQLLKAVTYQLGTTLVAIRQTIRNVDEEIREADTPQRLNQLAADGRVPTDMLKRFFFIDPRGRVVANGMEESELVTKTDLSDREYFRVHLDNPSVQTHIGRPFRGVTGAELIPITYPVLATSGELMGVLVAMIDIRMLEGIWIDIGFRPDDSIELVGEDGAVLFRWSQNAAAGGASGDDMSWSRRIAGWPISVVARLDPATVDRHSAPAKRAVVVSAAAGALMVGLFCVLLAWRARQAGDQRRAGEANQARLLATIDAVPVEFMEFDRDRRLVLANRASRQSQAWAGDPIGKTQRELLEETIVPVRLKYPDEDWAAYVDRRMANFDKNGEFEFARRNGECGRFYITDMPSGGRVVVRVDVTETKTREVQLAAEMERLNSVFQSTGAVLLMLDSQARIVLANQAVLDLIGLPIAGVTGRPVGELAFAGFDEGVVVRWSDAAGGGRLQPVEFECSRVNAGGDKRLFRLTANPVQDEAGRLRYIVVIGVDDTERRLSEIRLFDSSRLANLGEMATGMAHEINQPLAVIRMAADSLLEELDMPEAIAIPAELALLIKAKLARISGQTKRASGLVNDLRTVSRKPANDVLPFDVAEAARVAGDLLHEQLRAARIAFALELPPAALMARGEASRLQQVLINLVLNARDALLENATRPSGGTLGSITVVVAAAPAGGGSTIVIEDDGPGIPAHVLPRLFEPFFTTKPTGKGTGLGLSISYDIVKRMGGDITVENRPGGGARFTVALPSLDSVGWE